MVNRYACLIDLIHRYRPAHLVEVGTWTGTRAIEMAHAALSYSPAVFYQGFDLFDDATAETDARELNVKRHVPIAEAEAKLRSFKLRHPGFAWELIRGDSRDTLPEIACDLAFIDGGHSVETIASDYDRLKRSTVVVLDDFYMPDVTGRTPDLARHGCNTLVSRLLRDSKRRIRTVPAADPVSGGGLVTMVVITRG